MKYLLRGWSTITPFKPFRIVTSLYEVFTMSSGMKGVIVLYPLNKYFCQ
jgi:hypothetical protein